MIAQPNVLADETAGGSKAAERLQWWWATLRRWLWVFILLPIITFALTYEGLHHFSKPLYTASSTVEVNVPTGGFTGSGASVTESQSYAPTLAQLVNTMPVATDAYHTLGLHKPLTPRSLIKMTTASAIGGSALISISSTSHNPRLAEKVANAMAAAAQRQENIAQQSRFKVATSAILAQIHSYRLLIHNALLRVQHGTAGRAFTQRQIQSYRGVVERLNTTYDNLIANEEQSATTVVVRSPANLPTSPVSPKPLRDGILAALGALILAGLIVYLREYLTTTVGSPEEISRLLGGAHVMGGIQKLPADVRRPELIVASQPRAATAEAYRVIRTNTLYSNPDRPLRIVLVTSPREGEGKTTTAINVAASFAELGGRTLLVDADLRRPAIHKAFELDSRAGLTSAIISGPKGLDAAIHSTIAPNLFVLPSGPLPPNPAELLSSQRMHELIESLKSKFDHIVLDSPPVLPVADPVVLSTMVDCVLLVLDVGVSTRQGLVRTNEALSRVGAHISGVILNKLGADRRAGYYYHYYYGGGYTYGYREREGSREGSRSLPAGPRGDTDQGGESAGAR